MRGVVVVENAKDCEKFVEGRAAAAEEEEDEDEDEEDEDEGGREEIEEDRLSVTREQEFVVGACCGFFHTTWLRAIRGKK